MIIGIVPVEQFDNHVKKMHSDRDQHFENEYAVSQIINNFLFSKANITFLGNSQSAKNHRILMLLLTFSSTSYATDLETFFHVSITLLIIAA